MARINLEDNMMSSMMKMSDGNPGAISVMGQLMNEGGKIDPQDFMGGMGKILILDTWKIYGSHIWMLYKDICGENIRRMVMLMRATQLGEFSHSRLGRLAEEGYMSEERPTDEEWETLDNFVCDTLAEFARP